MKAFHAHLDVCRQCATAPFNLCSEGDRLLREAADNAVAADSARRPDAHLGAVEHDGPADEEVGYGHGI